MKACGCERVFRIPNSFHKAPHLIFSTICCYNSRLSLLLPSSSYYSTGNYTHHVSGSSFVSSRPSKFRVRLGPENGRSEAAVDLQGEIQGERGLSEVESDNNQLPQGNTAIISACFVGLLTGISVVLFNTAVRFHIPLLFFFFPFSI